jgi:L-aspartate oxidase
MAPPSDHWDYLIVGSGIAGLTFALGVADHGSVAIVTKDRSDESNSSYAQGGVASVWSPEDSFEAHITDTLAAGAGLCHEDVVEMVVRDGPERIRELIALGTRFDTHVAGDAIEYDLGREGGHSQRRVLHAGDLTGQEIVRALTAAVRRHPNVTIFENALAVDLLTDRKLARATSDPVSCWGAYVYDRQSGAVRTVAARTTVLCTGGAGKVYLYTTNPDVATGDGIAIAFRAGAAVGNMEFFQFHPTCLYHPRAKSFLISEALRGEGAILRLPNGLPFMRAYHPDAELAPRDVVARAIDHEMKVRGCEHVYLDITHEPASYLEERFPNIVRRCREFGIDVTREWIPVVPAAHYLCGGVVTDRNGLTGLGRLYACGEVAMTGLHGANRLASNSLLEALVFGHRAALHARATLASDATRPPAVPEWNPGTAVNSDESVVVAQNWDEVRRTMWNFVGIVRSDRRLERARKRIAMLQDEIREYYWDFLVTGDLLELRNIATVAELIVRSALLRRESRGLHFTLDYPERDDAHWRHDTIIAPSDS